jgi:hypothetical protein
MCDVTVLKYKVYHKYQNNHIKITVRTKVYLNCDSFDLFDLYDSIKI